MKNGDETEGKNKFVKEWFWGESLTADISPVGQDVPGSQIAEVWDGRIASFF